MINQVIKMTRMARSPDDQLTTRKGRWARLYLDSGESLAHTSAKSPASLAFCRFHPAPYRRRKAVVVPQSKPSRSAKIRSAFGRDTLPEIPLKRPSDGSGNLDETTAISSLKKVIAAGDHRLDPILATITDAAHQLTGASGAALAMWKEGAMVCRARSGEAPPLGARLNAETGISGECLRTGETQHCADSENNPIVDVEVCRSLGLRSIAVLPIQGWRGINGVLEVFSPKAGAFTEQHIALLQQLAALAERARASQPHGASAAAPKVSVEQRQPSGLLPASDRFRDVALAFLGPRSRLFALGVAGLLAISLLGLVIWIGWRGPDEGLSKAHAAAGVPAGSEGVSREAVTRVKAHPPDDDPVWKVNPGGETMLTSSDKTSAGIPVKLASKVDIFLGQKAPASQPADRPSSKGDRPLLATDAVAQGAIPRLANGTRPSQSSDLPLNDASSAEPPAISMAASQSVANQAALSGVLSAKASLPGLSAPVSQGVSGGQLLRRIPPVYPAQARLLRLEGAVSLTATVMEDGTVRDVKVVEGAPALAQSAVDAVKHWRYKPYVLDGTAVKNDVKIRIDFKLPSDSASR
jgi:TonB family protein